MEKINQQRLNELYSKKVWRQMDFNTGYPNEGDVIYFEGEDNVLRKAVWFCGGISKTDVKVKDSYYVWFELINNKLW